MNDLQTRILGVLHNIGGKGTTTEIRELGNIPKPLDIVNMNLRQMERTGQVRLRGQKWVINCARKKPNGKEKSTKAATGTKQRRQRGETREMVRKLREQNPDKTLGWIATEIGVSDPCVYQHMKTIREEDALVKSQASSVKPQPATLIPTTIAELEDAVQEEKRETDCVVLDAIDRLKVKLETRPNEVNAVQNFQMKYDVLLKLSEITEDSIAVVLKSISDDLAYLHSFADEPASDATV